MFRLPGVESGRAVSATLWFSSDSLLLPPQGFRLPQSSVVPGSPGPPSGHYQPAGRSEGLPPSVHPGCVG